MLGAACYWGSQDPARVPGMAELLRPHSDSPSPPATSSGLRKEGTVPWEKLWDQKGGQKPQRGQQGNESLTEQILQTWDCTLPPPPPTSPTSPPSSPWALPTASSLHARLLRTGHCAAVLLIITPLRHPRPLPHGQGKGSQPGHHPAGPSCSPAPGPLGSLPIFPCCPHVLPPFALAFSIRWWGP